MQLFLSEAVHLILHGLVDTLELLPFLFAAYLLIEYIEHRASDKLVALLSRFGRFSPVAGAVTGIVPQCGFSITSAKLYAGRLISFGTLAAVFISTSDEAIPILLSHPEHYGYIWKLIVIKLIVAGIAGFAIDALYQKPEDTQNHSQAHDHMHHGCAHDACEHGILRPAIIHTLQSALFIFLVIFAVEVVVELVGDATIASLFTQSILVQPFVAALVGFIPNCASSIILTELFATGAISFGALVAGLITNAGVGYVVLFRSNKDSKRNLSLVGITLLLGLLTGYVLQLF
jgi:hypothetical protein